MPQTPKNTPTDHRPWAEYSALLIDCGSLRELFHIVKKWADLLEKDNDTKETHPFSYPDALFEFEGKIYYDTGRSFRYIAGFIDSLSDLLHFLAPSYSTIGRRIYALNIAHMPSRSPKETQIPKDMAIDSSGFKIKGPGEYLQHKYHPKTRQDYEKTHIVVQVDSHEILSFQTTSGHVHDCQNL